MPDGPPSKQLLPLINKLFLIYDAILAIVCGVLTLVFVRNSCAALSLLIYSAFYVCQTLQHYLIFKFPSIDINLHHVLYRRLTIGICLVDVGYMLTCITFFQKTQTHPIYCLLCLQMGITSWVGLVLVLHEVFVIGWAVTLINAYVTRRYYLLALGGFEVEQRLAEERARQLNAMLIR